MATLTSKTGLSPIRSAWLLAGFLAASGTAFSLQMEEAKPYSDLGYQLARGLRGPLGADFTVGVRFLDGNVSNPSAESTSFDRTMAISTRSGYTMTAGSVTINALLTATAFRRLIARDKPVGSVTEALFYESALQVLAAKILTGDLALVGGISYDYLPAYTSTTESDNDPKFSHLRYASLGLLAFRAGLLKGSGTQQVGILVGTHGKASRTVTADSGTSEEPRQLEQTMHRPQTLTFAFMRGAPATRLRFELAAINGNRRNENTEQGYTASDFFSVLRISKGFPIGPYPLAATLVYKTFSYKSSSRVTVDTISAGALHLTSQVPTPAGNLAVHLYGSLGKEGQSIAEVNRQFDVIGFGGSLGLTTSF